MSQNERISLPIVATISAPPIELPDEALVDLRRIAGLEEGLFSRLLNAIGESQPALNVSKLAASIVTKVEGITIADLRSTLIATINLHSMRVRSPHPTSVEEHVNRVVRSPLVEKAKGFSQQNKATLRDRLKRLLSLDAAIGVTAKAQSVMVDQDHTFCNVRILTDIRPIFSESGEASAAVIIHNLRIGYHQDSKHQDFYVALDTDDIKKLKEAIERAEKKTATLQGLLKRSNVTYLEV
jgi:hypothetical protein